MISVKKKEDDRVNGERYGVNKEMDKGLGWALRVSYICTSLNLLSDEANLNGPMTSPFFLV